MVVGELASFDVLRTVAAGSCSHPEAALPFEETRAHSASSFLLPSGESGLGKTTLINTLFSTELAQPKNYRARFSKQLDKTTEVDIIKAEVSAFSLDRSLSLLPQSVC